MAFRPNIAEEVNPRVWYDWFRKGKISENQYFGALSVSVTDARNAIGNDQMAEVRNETLSKTPDLRIIELTPEQKRQYEDGDVIPFEGAKVKTSKQTKTKEVDNAGKTLESKMLAKKKKSKRTIRSIRA